MTVLRVCYNDLVEQPREQAERVSEFLGGTANVEGMVKTVDPSLYRNRKRGHETVALAGDASESRVGRINLRTRRIRTVTLETLAYAVAPQ